jgi:hypothetical protein
MALAKRSVPVPDWHQVLALVLLWASESVSELAWLSATASRWE